MNTFCAVDDRALVQLIRMARKQVVFIAPGLTMPVAEALGILLEETERIDVTVILDADEDVCRIGFGDVDALKRVHKLAGESCLALRYQPSLRVGVLLADEEMLVWSPTPRSVEAPPDSRRTPFGMSDDPKTLAPNGLMLGRNPIQQVAVAVAAEGTSTAGPRTAEIGTAPLTVTHVEKTITALERNPPIPVDLARITRVFSNKLQFVELKVKRAALSKVQLRVPNSLLNADVDGDFQELLNSHVRAFGHLRSEKAEVDAFTNDGEPAYDQNGNRMKEKVSEADLERLRRAIEKRYLYDVRGFGQLIEKAAVPEFRKQITAYETQLKAYSSAIRAQLQKQAQEVVADAVDLIIARSRRASASGTQPQIDHAQLQESLLGGLKRAEDEAPTVHLLFKDVTYEQTESKDFRDRVDKALPIPVRKRLGAWTEKYDAAKAADGGQPRIRMPTAS